MGKSGTVFAPNANNRQKIVLPRPLLFGSKKKYVRAAQFVSSAVNLVELEGLYTIQQAVELYFSFVPHHIDALPEAHLSAYARVVSQTHYDSLQINVVSSF